MHPLNLNKGLSHPMSQLVNDLIQVITDASPSDGTEFKNTVKDHLVSSSDYESFLTGISEQQYVHCISQSLQQIAENANAPEISRYAWNPIVASLVRCISTLAYRAPLGSSSATKVAMATPPRPSGSKSSSTPKPTAKSKPLPSSTRVTRTTVAKRTKVSTGSAIAVAHEQSKGFAKPSTSSTKVDTTSIAARLDLSAIRLAAKKEGLPFFNQMRGGRHGGPVSCRVTDCETCAKYFAQCPITRCADIKRHKPGSCTKYGWYPHVLPHIWACISRAHKDPSFSVKFLGLPDEQHQSLEPPPPSAFAPLPQKRSWAQAAKEAESEEEDICEAKKSPAWTGQSWAEQVEVAYGDVRSPLPPSPSQDDSAISAESLNL